MQEPNTFTGKVISLDGPYAIVQHNEETTEEKGGALKVYFKSSLEKVNIENNINAGWFTF